MRPDARSAALLGGLVAAPLLVACTALPVHAAPPTAPTAPGVSPGPSLSTRTTAPSPAPSPAGPLALVGLGDSVTSGEHCDCDDYVTGFGRLLAARDGLRVHVTNDGESGSTSDGLADDLAHDDDLRADVRGADVVVVTMGANDLYPALRTWRSSSCGPGCYDPEIASMRAHLDRVLDRVSSLSDDRARVLVTTYWNVFTDGDVARRAERDGYLAWSDAVTRRANAAIGEVAAAHGATLVDLYTPFKGEDGTRDPTTLLAPDGDHPNPAGTALISRTVLAAYGRGR